MSLQERTLVVRNFDPERTTANLLKELFLQGGPVRRVILRSDHAFVEFDDVESVGYTMALLDGVRLFDQPLSLDPKLRLKHYNKYRNSLKDYIDYDKHNRYMERRRQEELEQQRQMQMRMQMQYQMPAGFQPQPNLPFPNQQLGYPFAPPNQLQQQQQQMQMQMQYQPPQQMPRGPDFSGPQFRNYR